MTIQEIELSKKTGINKPIIQKWRKENLEPDSDFTRAKSFGAPIIYTESGLNKFNKAFGIEMSAPKEDDGLKDAIVLRNNFLNQKLVQIRILETGEVTNAICRDAREFKGANRMIWVRWDNGRWTVPHRDNHNKKRFYKG